MYTDKGIKKQGNIIVRQKQQDGIEYNVVCNVYMMDILHHWLNEHKDVQGFTKNIKQCTELTVYKLEI